MRHKRIIGSAALLVAGLLIAAGYSSSTGRQTSQQSTRPSVSASALNSGNAHLAPCSVPESGVPASPITPRFDGFYYGSEGRPALSNLVVVRFYPDHKVFYAVGKPDVKPAKAGKWLTPSYSNAHGHLTGPWTYDATGAFSKPTITGGTNSFGVFKYTGKNFNLHVVSHFGCSRPGTVHEETTYMTFASDGTTTKESA